MKIILALFFGATFLNGFTQGKFEFTNEKDSASYAAGLNEGERMLQMLQQGGADTIISQDLFLAGMIDFMTKSPRLTSEAAQMVLQSYFGKYQAALEEVNRRQEEEMRKIFEVNKEKSELFLAENKKKAVVTTTTSGLQYEIVKKGKGKNIKIGDKLKVHYTGKLTDGSLVDSSREGEPYEFELAAEGLIPGWIEALQLMKSGSQYLIYIPYDLGYGEMGKEPQVPPYSVLVFDIEIIEHTPQK